MLWAKCNWRSGERNCCSNNGIPPFVELDTHPDIEQPRHIVGALRIRHRMTGMYRCTVDTAVAARRRRGGQLAFGTRQSRARVVEYVLVGKRARLQDIRIARKQSEIGRLRPRGIDQGGAVPFGECVFLW